MDQIDLDDVQACADVLQDMCHGAAKESGWWTDIKTGLPILTDRPHLVGEKLMLIVSEVAEAMEGHRKNLNDDKLPHRKMVEVELADVIIRTFDLAGALNLDLGGAIAEKMAYNATRDDHKLENRRAEGGYFLATRYIIEVFKPSHKFKFYFDAYNNRVPIFLDGKTMIICSVTQLTQEIFEFTLEEFKINSACAVFLRGE